MPDKKTRRSGPRARPGVGKLPTVGAVFLSAALALQGCVSPVYPQLDRDERVMQALENEGERPAPPSPLTPEEAVSYALAHNLDAKVAEIEAAYQNESLVAARRRLLPSLTLRYSVEHSNHPSARWSESTKSGNQSLESSYSSDPNSRHGEVGVMWNLIDFGVGYLRSRQQGERLRHSAQQTRRLRQQVVLDVLIQYWRTSASETIALEAEALRAELTKQGASIRDSVEMRILSRAEGARRELAIHSALSELEQYNRMASQSRLELARVMGCGNSADFFISPFPDEWVLIPLLPDVKPELFQAAALKRRPELFQQDAQERIAYDEAKLALLQMAPNASLSLNFYDNPDKFLEWNNWMTVGAKVSWNLLNIPARFAERRMARLQGEVAKQKGLALAAAVMAQVGIAYSDWRLAQEYGGALDKRASARASLVEALAAGEKDGQTRPGEVLQERVRLLAERAAALRAKAEVRVAGARLANAMGLDVDDEGCFVWRIEKEDDLPPDCHFTIDKTADLFYSDLEAERLFPGELSGLRVMKAEDDLTSPEEYLATPTALEPIPANAKDDKKANAKTDAMKDDTKAGGKTGAAKDGKKDAGGRKASGKTASGKDKPKAPEPSPKKAANKDAPKTPEAKKPPEGKPAAPAAPEKTPTPAAPEKKPDAGDAEKVAPQPGGGEAVQRKTSAPVDASRDEALGRQLQAMRPPSGGSPGDVRNLPKTAVAGGFGGGAGVMPAMIGMMPATIAPSAVETPPPAMIGYDATFGGAGAASLVPFSMAAGEKESVFSTNVELTKALEPLPVLKPLRPPPPNVLLMPEPLPPSGK